tara:strand:+ start:122 stop:544 length:423 start_codon:yes stop_codon:yes gene_type:complete
MAQKKSKTKTKKAKTITKAEINTTKAKKTLVEEVIKKEPEIMGYRTLILFKREPKDTNITAAAVSYNENSESITLEYYVDYYAHAIKMLIDGDISVETAGNRKCISKTGTPELWILNLHKAQQFSGNPFIAGEAQPTYEA